MTPFEKLVWICQHNQFPLLRVEYAEGCNEYEVCIYTGEAENKEFYVKKSALLQDACAYIIKQMTATGTAYTLPPDLETKR